MTPSTLAYIEEAKLSGLPVIPFAYPTCVLVDKQKYKDVMIKTGVVSDKLENNSKAVMVATAETFEEFCNNQSQDLDELTKSPPGTLESIVDIAQRQLREEQPDQGLEMETDDYFFCGSVGSVSTLSEYNNNNRPRSRVVQASWDQAEADAMFDLETATVVKWHDYLDMTRKYPTTTTVGNHGSSGAVCQRRSEPIRIKEKQYWVII